MNLDMGLVIVALGNVGAVGIVGKFLLKGVEKSNESLPVILEAIKTHSKAIEDLFDSRNSLREDITTVQTIQKLHGCDLPIGLSDMQVKKKEIENA